MTLCRCECGGWSICDLGFRFRWFFRRCLWKLRCTRTFRLRAAIFFFLSPSPSSLYCSRPNSNIKIRLRGTRVPGDIMECNEMWDANSGPSFHFAETIHGALLKLSPPSPFCPPPAFSALTSSFHHRPCAMAIVFVFGRYDSSTPPRSVVLRGVIQWTGVGRGFSRRLSLNFYRFNNNYF